MYITEIRPIWQSPQGIRKHRNPEQHGLNHQSLMCPVPGRVLPQQPHQTHLDRPYRRMNNVLYIHCNSMYIHVYTMYRQFIYIFKHSCCMLGERDLPICTYWAQARSLGRSGVCQFVYTGHRQQSSPLMQCIYNYHIL
jgi:hypothetical protein